MKIVITLDVPDGSAIASTHEYPSDGPAMSAVYTPPFEDQLIPLPPEAIPVPGDPVRFRGMAQNVPQGTQCPIHHEPWKLVPAGVSKKTGKPYESFQACPERGCDQRPARAL